MDLQKELKELKEQFLKQLPPGMSGVYERLINDLSSDGFASKGPQAGDSLNSFQENFNFVLSDARGGLVEFADQIAKGPVVLSFYRGGWCPFCNLELKFLKSESAAFKKFGAQLLTISPEIHEHKIFTTENKLLDFYLLSDIESTVSKMLGISYAVPDYLMKAYESCHLHLKELNGTENLELPIPATYVIDQKLVVRYAFASEDFTKRAKISKVLKALEIIKAEK